MGRNFNFDGGAGGIAEALPQSRAKTSRGILEPRGSRFRSSRKNFVCRGLYHGRQRAHSPTNNPFSLVTCLAGAGRPRERNYRSFLQLPQQGDVRLSGDAFLLQRTAWSGSNVGSAGRIPHGPACRCGRGRRGDALNGASQINKWRQRTLEAIFSCYTQSVHRV